MMSVPHCSWNHATQLNEQQIVQITGQSTTIEFLEQSNRHYAIPDADVDYSYVLVITRNVSKQVKRPKSYYCCLPSECKSLYCTDKQRVFYSHCNVQHNHNKKYVCHICMRVCNSQRAHTIHLHHCSNTRKQHRVQYKPQIDSALQSEIEALQDEMNDDATSDTANDFDDIVEQSYDNHQRFVTYSPLLIRQETLELFIINNGNDKQHTEWIPQGCASFLMESSSSLCGVKRHGIAYRYCYDVNEPVLVGIPVYYCSIHKIKFNALHECVANEMLLRNNVAKTFDIMIFDRTVITDAVWCMISSLSLITLNDSHVAQVFRHNYKRYEIQKHYKHNKIVHGIDSYTKCSNDKCYLSQFSEQQNAVLICTYKLLVNRSIKVAQTKSIFQRHVVPKSVWPKATELQEQIITVKSSPQIAMDHTFKIARFGTYKQLLQPRTTNQCGKRKYTQTVDAKSIN